jgi:DNA-binding Lrp family transcriptional regulator
MENKYFGFVYETTNLINGKKYIGKCIFSRKNNWENYLGSGVYLKRAIKKYGKENFKREIIFLAIDKKELEEIEEFIIRFHDAVTSERYYNLKETSIGGDTFTNHPNREERLKKVSENSKGSNNPMYKREKTQAFFDSIKKANSIKICVDGVIYSSLTECSVLLGINTTTVNYRLRSNGFPNYYYLEDVEFVPREKINKRQLMVDGIQYKSIYEASKILGISRTTIRKRMKSEDYPSYQELDN